MLQRYRDFQPDLSRNEKDKSPGFLAPQTLSRIVKERRLFIIKKYKPCHKIFLFSFEQFFVSKKEAFW